MCGMRKLLVVPCLLLAIAPLAFPQNLTPAEQTSVDAVFAQYAKPASPGCALGVYRNGGIAYAKGYGFANLENEVPITSRTVFDIGSTSKQFTAFAILLLEQQGKLSLEDDVRKFIPELPDYGKPITLRHLITHTSGIRDYTGLFEFAGVPEQNLTTDQDALDLIVRQKHTNFAPGEEWDYSNSGFFLLSQVVKRVSGKRIRDFSQENIFKPLGMSSTQIFDWYGLVIPRRATGYSYDSDRKAYAVEMSNFEQAGDGSVQTSIEDLLRWDENFYTAKLGGANLLARMQTVGKLNNGQPHGYAAGLFISKYRGLPIVRHGGAWAGYRAELLRFTQQHTSVAVLCNLAQSNPSRLADQVADVVLASALAPKAEAVASEAKLVKVAEDWMRARVGWYRNQDHQYRQIVFKDGKLFTGRRVAVELVPVSENTFRQKGSEITFTFGDDGGMNVQAPGLPATPFSHVKVAPPRDLTQFAGSYFSAELQTTWDFRVKGDKLTVYAKRLLDPAEPLDVAGEDTFILGGGEVQFVSKPGEPIKAIVGVGRIRGLEFVRSN